jgi:hypothetical protein
METPGQLQDQTPPDCFRLSDLEVFKSFEKQTLTAVNYFVWLNRDEAGAVSGRFLYMLELVFDGPETLLLSSGDDSEAIRVGDVGTLLKTATALHTLHGAETIERIDAVRQPLWQFIIGKPLEAVRLTRHESGLYRNDALLLDFNTHGIVVSLGLDEGLILQPYN